MSGRARVVLNIAVMSVACLGVGWVAMKAVTPTPEQTYASLAPDLRRQVDAKRAARLARQNGDQVTDALTNPDPEKPVWRE